MSNEKGNEQQMYEEEDAAANEFEGRKVEMSQKTMAENWASIFIKDETLQQLRECAENVKEGNPTVIIPDNKFRLEPGTYTGEELGAVIYFIADMLE